MRYYLSISLILILLLGACQSEIPTPTTTLLPAPTFPASPTTPSLYPPPVTAAASALPAYPAPLPGATSLPATSEPAPSRAAPTPTPSLSLPSWLARALQRAREDLGRRTGMEPAAIELVALEAAEFPAGDLGCPAGGAAQPIPALVTGNRIILQAGDTRYIYHAHGTDVRYCGPE